MRHLLFYLNLLFIFTLSSCDRNNNVNLIDLEQDVTLGKQISEEILSNREQFPVLDPREFPQSYAYLQNMVNTILESGEVAYREEFPWKIFIIKDDNTLNAFATPGGYIYVYTGLIKFLDTEGDLAGVIGHEIAHADLRHSSRQLQKSYGLNFILSMLVGGDNGSIAAEIAAKLAGQLAGLRFSREYEKEADARSVEYLAETPYPCNGAGIFFQKMQEVEQEGRVLTFLSTHPHPENRVKEIEKRSKRLGCSTEPMDPTPYQRFKNTLP